MCKCILPKRPALVSSLSFAIALLGVFAVTAAPAGAATSGVTTSSLGQYSPTFVGPAATGCASGCSLLSGPVATTSTASSASTARAAANRRAATPSSYARGLPAPNLRARPGALAASAMDPASLPLPTVSCGPSQSGCDSVSKSADGATGVKGLDAVDSVEHSTLVPPPGLPKDIEPPDQGLCAGNGYVIQANNIGEILVFNTALARRSAPISFDTIMGLTSRGWSNGGHWFFTEIVSSTTEQNGGAFSGCFSGSVASSCYEGIAVSKGSSPFGPYYTYYLNANYDPNEPGYPYLLNDFAKISVTRDAFLMFYDEFPLNGSVPGVGGGFFNGAQELAFDKGALESGQPVVAKNGKPNRKFNVAIENMGRIPTPDGTCASDNTDNLPGVTCWYSVIPAEPADSGQFDNSHGGSGFMLASLDFYGQSGLTPAGDDRLAVFDWTGLSGLVSNNCNKCKVIQFGGQLFSGVDAYSNGAGALGAQKAGPIPLGDECTTPEVGAPSAPCAEGGIASNGDNMTQVSQAQGQLWGAVSTQVNQTYGRKTASEVHLGGAYWVVGTDSFDRTGQFSLTNQGYVSAAHEDLEFPTMAGEGTGGNGGAIMVFTLNGNGGPTGANDGGFYPSTAYGRLTATSNGLTSSTIHIADLGRSPQDGFTEYAPFPTPGNPPRPRWGDYGWAIYLPGGGDRLYFSNEYIEYPSCTGSDFTLTYPTCGGTRDGYANWGTSVNYVVP
jgi:hypothetical protein